MFLIYDLVFIIFSFLYLPRLIFRRKFHRGIFMRLGFFPPPILEKIKGKDVIWLHAVSVGEVMAASSLISALREEFPSKKLLLSTVTSTGNRIAQRLAKEDEAVIYLPLDLSFVLHRVVKELKPSIFITMETELWPNLIRSLSFNNVSVVLVNGRISPRSFQGYKLIRLFLRKLLAKIDLFCMQTELDKDRIICLGAQKEKVRVTGNMKFDVADYPPQGVGGPANLFGGHRIFSDYTDKVRSLLGIQEHEELLVAGSTHPPEEEIILDVYKRVLVDFPNLKLLIAPRHIERIAEIERLIKSRGFQTLRFSLAPKTYNLKPVFLLDTIGQLRLLYGVATVVFMGGSLVKRGGQNILEPAGFAKPILFGPHMFNFKDIAELFLNKGAAILVKDEKELELHLSRLLSNPRERQNLGMRAKMLLQENRGATNKNIESIKNIINRETSYF